MHRNRPHDTGVPRLTRVRRFEYRDTRRTFVASYGSRSCEFEYAGCHDFRLNLVGNQIASSLEHVERDSQAVTIIRMHAACKLLPVYAQNIWTKKMGNRISESRQPDAEYDVSVSRATVSQSAQGSRSNAARTVTHSVIDPRLEAIRRQPTNAPASGSSNRRTRFPSPTSPRNVDRPDLSNIDSVDKSVAVLRSKEALRSFAPSEFDLADAVSSAGLSERLGEGACLGVSLEWATARMKNPQANIIGKGGHLSGTDVLTHVFRVQREYEIKQGEAKSAGMQLDPEAASRTAIGQMLASRGINFSHSGGGFDTEAIARTVSAPGTHIISLTGLNDGHAISVFTPPAHTRDPRLIVFDPNAGEFRMHSSEADYFFTALQARYNTIGWRYGGVDIFSVPA